MRVGNAPMSKPFWDGRLFKTQGWSQWFSSLGTALFGEWSVQTPTLAVGGGAPSPSGVTFVYRGATVFVDLRWSDASDLGGGSVILPKQVQAMILPIYDSTGLAGVATASGTTITLPSVVVSGTAHLVGELILEVA